MQMLRIQPSNIAPSVPAPCCSPSSSSPSPSPSSSSAARYAGNLRLHWRAANSRSSASAAATLSLHIDLNQDARRRRRRQCCRWCAGTSILSCCKASLGGGSNEQLPDWRRAKDDDGFLQASLLVSGSLLSPLPSLIKFISCLECGMLPRSVVVCGFVVCWLF